MTSTLETAMSFLPGVAGATIYGLPYLVARERPERFRALAAWILWLVGAFIVGTNLFFVGAYYGARSTGPNLPQLDAMWQTTNLLQWASVALLVVVQVVRWLYIAKG